MRPKSIGPLFRGAPFPTGHAAGILSASETMKTQFFACTLAFALPGLVGCATDVCPTSPAVANSAFVFASTPSPGSTVTSGFQVSGCSQTFESNVNWKLLGRAGNLLASGHTTGGGVDGAAGFGFNVNYSISQPEVGHLEVFEDDASDGEGFPPGRTVIPLVLQP